MGRSVKVHSDVPYGPILEYGDSRQAAHPVGERAVDEHGKDAIGGRLGSPRAGGPVTDPEAIRTAWPPMGP
jgi:hypothetical protein